MPPTWSASGESTLEQDQVLRELDQELVVVVALFDYFGQVRNQLFSGSGWFSRYRLVYPESSRSLRFSSLRSA